MQAHHTIILTCTEDETDFLKEVAEGIAVGTGLFPTQKLDERLARIVRIANIGPHTAHDVQAAVDALQYFHPKVREPELRDNVTAAITLLRSGILKARDLSATHTT